MEINLSRIYGERVKLHNRIPLAYVIHHSIPFLKTIHHPVPNTESTSSRLAPRNRRHALRPRLYVLSPSTVHTVGRHLLMQGSRCTAGTNPIHNKKPKKVQKEEDEDDKAHKAKLQAGMFALFPIPAQCVAQDLESLDNPAQPG